MTSKELVLETLEFRNRENRVPRQLWLLPWAQMHYPDRVAHLLQGYQWDIEGIVAHYRQVAVTHGDAYAPGEFTDEWGCTFENITPGIIGEVKHPLVNGDEWEDASAVHIPEEMLSFDIDEVNRACEKQADQFLLAGYVARPFERLQFIRGTVNLYMDLMDPPPKMMEFIRRMHDFYCRIMEKWAKTDVDALSMMDDWGSQNDLLISPDIWEEIFMPMYRDYIEIAHSHNKKMFMHSDGNTLRIIPKLIDLGLDALNTQIFCIGVKNLAPFKGKLAFWGEIDRQNLIPRGTCEEVEAAVQSVYDTLWQDGGCIAQCEFGPGGNPDNVDAIFKKWASLR